MNVIGRVTVRPQTKIQDSTFRISDARFSALDPAGASRHHAEKPALATFGVPTASL